MSAFELNDRQIRRAMETASLSGAEFLLPLCTAALERKLTLIVLVPEHPWPKREIQRVKGPCLILVGDDCELSWIGPSAWPQELQNWSRDVMVHAAAGTPESYRLAVSRCMEAGRYILVETDSGHLKEWVEFFTEAEKPVSLDLIVPEGGQHPLPVDRSRLQ